MSMNREQRRNAAKQMGFSPGEPINLASIMITDDKGKAYYLDPAKVTLVDTESNQPLFREVLEPVGAAGGSANTPSQEFPDEPATYSVQFDTPDGPMEFVKNGDWTGVRKIQQ